MSYHYSFPALKGFQAGREYFVIMCPLKLLSKIFIFNEDQHVPPEFRAQRLVNESRIPEIAEYILENEDEYVFSSLTASIDGEYHFNPISQNIDRNVGIIQIDMDSRFLINDGQHRRYAIEEALKADPSLGDETISVVLFIDEDLKRSQQMFSDLNKHAINISKSIGILYDSRDAFATLSKKVMHELQALTSITDSESTSLAKYSGKFFTLSNIYKTNKRLVGKHDPEAKSTFENVLLFWKTLLKDFIEWRNVIEKNTTPYHSRQESVSSYGVIMEAFGLLANEILDDDFQAVWPNIVKKLNRIDWSRSNDQDWLDRVISKDGRILSRKKSIELAKSLMKQRLGLPLTDRELLLENELKEGNS